MNITLSVSGELEDSVKTHKHIKWTEIAREAMREEVERLKKLEALQKHLEKKPISRQEWHWMEKIDWHPVDEMKYKEKFVKESLKAGKEKPKKVKSLDELLK